MEIKSFERAQSDRVSQQDDSNEWKAGGIIDYGHGQASGGFAGGSGVRRNGDNIREYSTVNDSNQFDGYFTTAGGASPDHAAKNMERHSPDVAGSTNIRGYYSSDLMPDSGERLSGHSERQRDFPPSGRPGFQYDNRGFSDRGRAQFAADSVSYDDINGGEAKPMPIKNFNSRIGDGGNLDIGINFNSQRPDSDLGNDGYGRFEADRREENNEAFGMNLNNYSNTAAAFPRGRGDPTNFPSRSNDRNQGAERRNGFSRGSRGTRRFEDRF